MPATVTKVKVTQNGVTTTYIVDADFASTGTGRDKIITFSGHVAGTTDTGTVEIHVDDKDICYVTN